MGTLFVSLVLAGIVALIIVHLVRQHKKGLCAGCSQCSAAQQSAGEGGGGCPHCHTASHAEKAEQH